MAGPRLSSATRQWALFSRPFVLVGHRFASSFQQRGW
jgi:hypothetical protein